MRPGAQGQITRGDIESGEFVVLFLGSTGAFRLAGVQALMLERDSSYEFLFSIDMFLFTVYHVLKLLNFVAHALHLVIELGVLVFAVVFVRHSHAGISHHANFLIGACTHLVWKWFGQ